ncbi:MULTISPECIES: DUF397 domain-containing protein [unclassified Streptomyces]|uniref:DUF397 domain-containing protein n=1 Tax=unclassified Streptomyces TaxID=2593676 RepID=UPI00382441EA
MSTVPCPSTADGWFKSSYSNGSGGECVEASFDFGTGSAVRDSKQSEGPQLRFRGGAWGTFIAALRAGRLG